jgi:hypothetical protein
MFNTSSNLCGRQWVVRLRSLLLDLTVSESWGPELSPWILDHIQRRDGFAQLPVKSDCIVFQCLSFVVD